VLAADLRFVPTLWPKGTRLAALLAGVGKKEARRAGYTSVAAWLRAVVYPPCFQAAVACVHTPISHRRGRKRRRDAAGRVERVAPVDLPPEWFEWWVKKEVQRRAEPLLRDLLGADARIPGARAFRPVEESPDPQSTTDGVGAGEDADRIAAARRDLCRFCDPEESNPLSHRQRQLLALALEGYSTAEIRAALQFATDQAVFAAMSRLRQKLPHDLRAVLSPYRRRSHFGRYVAIRAFEVAMSPRVRCEAAHDAVEDRRAHPRRRVAGDHKRRRSRRAEHPLVVSSRGPHSSRGPARIIP
jgi:hypothetical protein